MSEWENPMNNNMVSLDRGLRLGRWRFQRQARGFVISYQRPDNRWVAAFPVVKDKIEVPVPAPLDWLFYPWVLYQTIKAIRAQQNIVWENRGV